MSNSELLRGTEIVLVVSEVGSVLLGDEVPCVSAGELNDADVWTSTISIRGRWNGAVQVSCRREFAVSAACSALNVEASNVTDEDAKSMLREIANVIGGNIKALISAETGQVCQLSIPDFGPREEESGDLREMWFKWRGRMMRVRIVEGAAEYVPVDPKILQ